METFPDSNTLLLPPGFRFHPTDEELITHYLSPKALDSSFTSKAIVDVDLNKFEPWDLPWMAAMGEKEWYFFCLRDRKYPTGSRTNRATEAGYWKATGKDKEIYRGKVMVGMKKTLVFYRGRAPKGVKTNWVMHEYRLEGKFSTRKVESRTKNERVICRVFNKSAGGKKVHISCLKPCGASGHLPPLMDMSINEHARASNESNHVTCFSNSMEDPQIDEFSPSAENSTFLPHLIQPTRILHCPDMPDQSTIRMLLNTNNNPPVDGVSSYEMIGMRPYDEFTGPVDLDCLWNY